MITRRISKTAYKRLYKITRPSKSQMFLLTTKMGGDIITNFVRVPNSRGCYYLTGAGRGALTKYYIREVRKNRQVVAICRTTRSWSGCRRPIIPCFAQSSTTFGGRTTVRLSIARQ